MPFTIDPAPATGAYLTTNFRHVGYNNEKIAKGNVLYNAGGNFQSAMRAYEGLTQAGIVSPNVTQSYTVTGQNTVATSLGQYAKVGDFLMLRFEREHPVATMAGTIIYNEFMVLAPHPDIIDEENPADPVDMVRGVSFALAETRPQALGALVDWLEDALTVTVLKVRYPGNWTYAGAILGGLDKQYDGE